MKRLFTGKTCAILLAVAFLLCAVSSACAQKCEYTSAQQFADYLDSKEVIYEYGGVDDGYERIDVTYTLDYFKVTCCLFFKEDNEQVNLRIWEIEKPTADRNTVLASVNKLNYNYKFGKFLLDEGDGTLSLELDMYISGENSGYCAYRGMNVLLSILDDEEIAAEILSLK